MTDPSAVMPFKVFAILNGLALAVFAHEGHEGPHGHGLPKPLSDLTATLVNDIIYLAGGCDSKNGNVYSQETGFFDCLSISKSFYGFDTKTETFKELAEMPAARFRHAAAAANGKLYLHGGRQVDGWTIVKELHVYDIEKNEWSNFSDFDPKYNISDHAAFSHGNYVYFSGGYLQDYTAVGSTFRVDATAANPKFEDMQFMNVARGDVTAAFTDDYAIVAGGFTDENEFCEPHYHGERFWFANNSWTNIADMNYGGAERVLVHLSTGVFAIGGESVPGGKCENPEMAIGPGEKATPLDKMERYDVATNKWQVLDDLPDYRFRFAAVGMGNKIYTFGGQTKFDPACNCHRTTDWVIVYTENGDGTVTERIIGGSSASVIKYSTATLVASAVALFWAVL